MSVKTILPFGDAILRKKAKPVTELNDKAFKLLDDMAETLYATDGRAGLAAPQIGILRQLVVMDCGEGLIELINPEIIESEGEQIDFEACLSFPGYYGKVKRAERVKVKTLNRLGESIVLEGEGFLARCMQHEIDHLHGILFVDHVQDNWLLHESDPKQSVALAEVLELSHRNK